MTTKYYKISENGLYEGEINSSLPSVPVGYTAIAPVGQPWNKRFDGSKWIEYQPVEESWLITKFAFKKRFPAAKWRSAKSLVSLDARLADFFEDFELAKYIDLKFPDLIAGVNFLSTEEVPVEIRLTQEEVSSILNTPCQPGEEI